jgi:hypothetical protein
MMRKPPILICLVICLLGGILFTWPLATHFFSAIPYTLKPIEGYEQVPLMPGDHLQAFYWYWLLADNLFGSSSFLTNPYEFNGPHGPMSTVYAFFPYSLVYVLFLPFGPLGAYNALIFLSFLSCGLSMFLLARTWTDDPWASLSAGLAFAALPYRVSHIGGGQLTGHIIFFLPLTLFFVEKTLLTGRWAYGIASGIGLVIVSWMDPHTSYLMALTLGLYVPGRILLKKPLPLVLDEKGGSVLVQFLGPLTGGLSLAFFIWMKYGKASPSFSFTNLFQALFLGVLIVILVWLFLSVLIFRWTTLPYGEARSRTAKAFWFLLPLLAYGMKDLFPFPRPGMILNALSLILFTLYLLRLWWIFRDPIPLFDWTRPLILLLTLGSGLGLAIVHLMQVRSRVILPSIAGKGRALGEVILFSPRPANLFFWLDINQEKFVFIGWTVTVLAALGIALLFRRRPPKPDQLALAGVSAFLGTTLSLGPKLTIFPLYQVLYQFVPFFNYPRVPGRFLFIGIIFLCLLAASALAALRQVLGSRGWVRAKNGLVLFVLILIAFEYHSGRPLGMTELSGGNRIYPTIRTQLPNGEKVLELPIWPGDSHQSSAYEYTVTRTRRAMINGYAPVVPQKYIEEVFWPLFPLDFGEWREEQTQKIKELKVGLITFHDQLTIYPEKISPFPARLALKRLQSSPRLRLIAQDQGIYLFRRIPSETHLTDLLPSRITSPVSALYPANYLSQETGTKETVPQASGYYLLMNEKALKEGKTRLQREKGGNVAAAYPERDRPGYLVVSPHRFFPAGSYQARFRLQRGPAAQSEEIGHIEILRDRKNIIGRAVIYGKGKGSEGWEEIPVDFEVPRLSEIGFRLYFTGKAPLKFNTAIIAFADQQIGPGSVEAEDLFRQTGYVVPDPSASGREAVYAQQGRHPPLYLTFGPYRTFSPGRYRAGFFIRSVPASPTGSDEGILLLEIATDYGKRVLARKEVKAGMLRHDRYQPVTLEFLVPFPCELGFRTKFLNRQDVWVDRIEVVRAENGAGGR